MSELQYPYMYSVYKVDYRGAAAPKKRDNARGGSGISAKFRNNNP